MRNGYFLPFFFFFFLSDAAPPPAAAPPLAACAGAVAMFGVAPVADAVVDDVAAVCVAVAALGAGSGFASCKGCSDPAIASIIALLNTSSRPRMAEERVRYLIVVVSSVTLRVRLCVEGRDLMR